MFISLLCAYTVALLSMAVSAVRSIARKEKFEVHVEAIAQEDLDVMGQNVPAAPPSPPLPGICPDDLKEGDKVYFETQNGSKYHFTLICREEAVFRVKGVRTDGRTKTVDIERVICLRFARGRDVLYWTMAMKQYATTPVTRLLVSVKN